MRLAVGYPWSSPFMFTKFVDSTINIEHPEGYNVKFFRGRGWCPARRHVHICEQALDWGAELICIIGADQVHPPDMLCRLTKRWEEGCEVIAAMVPSRGYVAWQEMKPFQPMAWRFKTNDELGANEYRHYRNMDQDADMIHVIKREDGDLVKANFIGSGVLMFHKDHLLALKKPWFYENIIPDTMERIANMDCTFVWRLQDEACAFVWVDTTIIIKHIHTFEIDDTYSERFSDWERPEKGDSEVCRYLRGRTHEKQKAVHRDM